MARFELTIEGDDLAQARAALDRAGIPTISSGGDPVTSPRGGRAMRGCFRSAVFPILLVIVIAFFVQRLVGPAEQENAPSYDQFLAQVENAPATIDRVTLDPDDTAIEVEQRNGDEYELGYPPSAEELLVGTLRRQRIETVVEQSGGSSILSLIAYLLPFLLFFAFWLFVMKRMERRNGGRTSSAGLVPQGLKAVVDAESAEGAEQRVRTALPTDRAYGVVF